jgi:hypothetical protein
MKRAICTLFTTTLLFAGDLGSIAGRLTYDNNTYILGAHKTVDNMHISVTTDEHGTFSMPSIHAGSYTLIISHGDWSSSLLTDVPVYGSRTTHIICSVTRESGDTISAHIRQYTVRNDVSRIDVIGASDISRMPVTNIDELIILQPGIIESEYGYHLRGGTANSMGYYLDGIVTSIPVPLIAIEELQVDGHGLDPEYGFASSGVISITTKQTMLSTATSAV